MNSRGDFIEEFIERITGAARIGGASEFDLATLRALLVDRLGLESIALARRVQKLELQLADMTPGERRHAICARLGIGKSRFYELREIPLSERNSAR